MLIWSLTQKPAIVDEPSTSIPEDFMSLPVDERRDYYLQDVWGSDYSETILGKPIFKTPWPNIDVDGVVAANEYELEVLTHTIYQYNPYLLLPEDKSIIQFDENFSIDARKIQDKFSLLRFAYGENSIELCGYRNGTAFSIEYTYLD